MLPDALTASLEARRLASIQLEEQENFALEERRLNDRANLSRSSRSRVTRPSSSRRRPRHSGLAKLEERLRAYPIAAQYDLEMQRIKVAQQLAGNSRAVVSMGGGDLVSGLLAVQQSGIAAVPPAPDNGAAPATPATPAPPPEEAPGPPHRAVASARRRSSG